MLKNILIIIRRNSEEDHLSAALSALREGFIVMDTIPISENGLPEHSIRSKSAAGFSADGLGLAPREHDVLELIMTGCSNRDIAEQLGIGVGTVKSHVSSILRKSGAHSRIQLACALTCAR